MMKTRSKKNQAESSESLHQLTELEKLEVRRKRAKDVLIIQRDLAIVFSTASDLKEAMARMLTTILRIDGLDGGGVYIVNDEGGLDLIVHEGLNPEFVEATSHFSADAPQTRLVMAGKVVRAQYSDIAPPGDKARMAEHLRGMVVYPIHYKEKVVAVLNMASRTYDEIPDSAFKALESIVAQIGSAIARRWAEEAQRESDLRFRTLYEAVQAGVFVLSTDGTITHVNKVASEILGMTVEQIRAEEMADSGWQMVREDGSDVSSEEYPIRITIRTGKPIRNTVYGVFSKDSSRMRWLLCNTEPLFDSSTGKPKEVLVTFSDITETRRLQDLESRAQRLETAGKIAGQVAHDFNNLMGPLMAYPELMRNKLAKDHPIHTYINQIEQATTKMADINQQLLTLSRRGHYDQEPVDLNCIVIQAVNQLYSIPKKLKVVRKLTKEIMPIKGGMAQIFRVVMNLINNACDAMQDIGKLTVKTENFYIDDVSGKYNRIPQGEYVKLTISDTGIGMAPEIMAKMYDPFFSTKASDEKRGSGLGLSIVHSVMEDHDSFIDCVSKPGKGTSFYLYFPITREDINNRKSDKIVGGTERILVVDDDQMQREVCFNLLESLGYKAHMAESGEEAIRHLQSNRYDLLILDMIMPPGMDGTQTYQKALEINPDQKAIIVSGFSKTERVNEALQNGVGAFVKKPLTIKALSLAVRKELDLVAEKAL